MQQANTLINDWLDITKYDEQYNVGQHYEKQVLSRLDGTCEWIFSKPAYRTWASEDFSDGKTKLLWICGPPGYGKTTLYTKLVEHFKERLALPIAYFFSSSHAQSGGRPSAIIRSWIGQIVRADSDALDMVRGYCEQSKAGRVASETEIWFVFESIISQKLNYTFAVDGFDEYARLDECRAQFLRRLKKATYGTSTRILISSRDEVDIRSELLSESSEATGQVVLECKISREDVRDDITFYSKRVVDEKLPKKDEALRQDLASQLAERCEGMFLWIKLQQDQLRGGKNGKQLHNIVKNMPSGLNQTYERNWKTIQSRPVGEQRRALAILRWVTFALRPLTISEITEALIVDTNDDSGGVQWDELPDIIDDEYINGEIIDVCGCLVEARKENAEDPADSRTIHLIHPSVREFLLSVLSPSPQPVLHHSLLFDQATDRSGQHNYLAKVCLTYLNHGDVWKRSDFDQDLNFKYSFYNYAANYWYSHIDVADQDDDQVIRLVNEFLRFENRNFELWRNEFDPWRDVTVERDVEEKAAPTPLHCAALFNLIPSMKFILKNGSSQLNSLGGKYGTPLQVACAQGHRQAVDTLIQWGADPNVLGGWSGVPLNAAIAGGHVDMVKSLVNIGASLELRDSLGRTPLYIASVNGYLVIVDFLLEAGAELKVEYEDGWAPLSAAASNCHIEVVKLLLDRGADITMSDHDGTKSMHWAASNGHVEVIKLLLDRGADVTMSDNYGGTSMHRAAYSGQLEVITLLLNRGANLMGPNSFGWTPMHSAAETGRLEVVEFLLDRGADPNLSSQGWTCIHLAALYGHLKVVKVLLEKGVDVMTNENGWTPLHAAAFNGHPEMVKLLLDRGADVLASYGSSTPLHVAAEHGQLEAVKLLLDRGPHLIVRHSRLILMHLAAQNSHLEVIKLLLDREEDVITSSEDEIPMNWAAKNGYLEVVKLLLDRGADIMNSIRECTPIHLAATNGHLEVVQLLLNRGADVIANDDISASLHLAAENGHLEVVQLLLNQGGSVLSSYKPGDDVFGLRFDANLLGGPYGSMLNTVAYQGQLKMLQVLVENYNADITATDSFGRTPLHIAARGGHIDCVDYLLGSGLLCSDVDNVGNNVFYYACSGGSIEVVRKILELDTRTVEGSNSWTSLHWACRTGSYELILLLLSHGIQESVVKTTDPLACWTPASIAIFHQNPCAESVALRLSIRDMEVPGSSCAESSRSAEFPVDRQGTRHEGYWCDGCFHVSLIKISFDHPNQDIGHIRASLPLPRV